MPSRARRQRLLAGISDRQKKRTKDKAAQMSERRLEAEKVFSLPYPHPSAHEDALRGTSYLSLEAFVVMS